jgi:hypothetical protein
MRFWAGLLFEPEVVFYSRAWTLASDTLGKLTDARRNGGAGPHGVRVVKRLGVPEVVTMGAATRPHRATVAAHAATYRTAAEVLG